MIKHVSFAALLLAILGLAIFGVATAIANPTAGAPVDSDGDDHAEGDGDADSDADADAPANATINEQAPGFTLTSAEGEEVSLSDFEGHIVVLEWINFDCPFVKKHYRSGNIQAIQKKYQEDHDVIWLTICSSKEGSQGHFDGDALTERIEEEAWAGTHYLLDTDGTVGRRYVAKVTPHMYVIDAEGVLRYDGAIDSIRSVSQDDIEKATPYVVDALDALIDGEDVETQVTQPYGCSVKY